MALFSVLFIRYAHSAFLKARAREMATLSLLGMLPRQLARVIRYEHLTIGLGATTAGVVLGLAFLRLFLLAMSRVLRLEQPLAFQVAWPAVGWTVLGFLLVFGAVALLGRLTLGRLPVAALFRSATEPKEPPRFSGWAVLARYGAYQSAWLEAERNNPVGLELVGSPAGLTPERVARALGPAIRAREQVASLPIFGDLPAGQGRVHVERIMPASSVNRWLATGGAEPVTVAPGEAVLLLDYEYAGLDRLAGRPAMQLGPDRVLLAEARVVNAFNENAVLVVDDDRFHQLAQGATVEEMQLYCLADWRRSIDQVLALRAQVKAGH